jgi:thiamine-monophosphate kinase
MTAGETAGNRAGETVGELGEWGLIGELAARMPAGRYSSIGIGDDSAVVTAPSGDVVAAVDLLLEGRHFLRSWSSAFDVGVKAAARSLADIAAMGATPTALLVAVGLPGALPVSWALDLASGLASEASRAGAGIVGGDTAAADSVMLSVTALGDLAGVSAIRRGGAVAGDVVAVAGPLGHSAAGHALLRSGAVSPGSLVLPDSAANSGLSTLVAAHLRPAPPYDAGPEAARLGATAMIDVSDGLVADLGHIATASGVVIDVAASALLVSFGGSPLFDAAAVVAAPETDIAESTMLDWILGGGEDHSLVATFPPSVTLPPRWRVIGDARPAVGAGGVMVDGKPYSGPGGWQHFR